MAIAPKPANWDDMQLVKRVEWLENQRLAMATKIDAIETKQAADAQTLIVIKGLLKIT